MRHSTHKKEKCRVSGAAADAAILDNETARYVCYTTKSDKTDIRTVQFVILKKRNIPFVIFNFGKADRIYVINLIRNILTKITSFQIVINPQ